jgi:predicted O-methyltransferase YrrM
MIRDWLSRNRPAPAAVPIVERTSHLAPGNQWYEPSLAGPSTLASAAAGADAVRAALAVLERLTPDKYNDFVRDFYRAGLDRFGDRWHYADISTVVMGLARLLQPAVYMEIGVRTGRSLAMVSAVAPDAHLIGFDLWIENYAGMQNPGADFVESQLRRLGHRGRIDLIAGDSATTVPGFFAQRPDVYPEIITVDGDHTEAGARRDLMHVAPHVPIGGALVFDDISNPSHPELRAVWDETIAATPRFAGWAFDEIGFGVAFAVRRRA